VIIAGTRSDPERLLGSELSAGAFEQLGVKPILGRDFAARDNTFETPEVALLSHALWQRRFGGDPSIVDTPVVLNGKPTTIVGVMPKGLAYPEMTDIWVPQRKDPSKGNSRGSYHLFGSARLKPEATLAQAQAEADTIMQSLSKEFPLTNEGIGARFQYLRHHAAGDASHLMLLLFNAD